MSTVFNVVTLFPEMFHEFLKDGVIGRAVKNHFIQVNLINPRAFTSDVHQSVDDKPFGGGDGMLMLGEPLVKSLESLGETRGKVVYLSPHGKPWINEIAREWSKLETPITLIAGRYAGVDQRLLNQHVHEEISLGDFVLSGGEVPAMAVIDSICRFLPGVLGNELSPLKESFFDGLLECPQFTRPREWQGHLVPEVLTSGDHQLILEYQKNVSLLWTAQRRPDLLSSSHWDQIPGALEWWKMRSIEDRHSVPIEVQTIKSQFEKHRGSM